MKLKLLDRFAIALTLTAIGVYAGILGAAFGVWH